METYFEKLGTNGEEDDCLPTDIVKKLMIKSDLNYAGQRHLEKCESTGIDCVRNEIMKQCLNNSSSVDTTVTLLNQIFETGNYPNIWKTDIVKPIHKNGSTKL